MRLTEETNQIMQRMRPVEVDGQKLYSHNDVAGAIERLIYERDEAHRIMACVPPDEWALRRAAREQGD